MNQRKAGTLLSYAHIIITNTISLFYTPYMLRMMGQVNMAYMEQHLQLFLISLY